MNSQNLLSFAYSNIPTLYCLYASSTSMISAKSNSDDPLFSPHMDPTVTTWVFIYLILWSWKGTCMYNQSLPSLYFNNSLPQLDLSASQCFNCNVMAANYLLCPLNVSTFIQLCQRLLHACSLTISAVTVSPCC